MKTLKFTKDIVLTIWAFMLMSLVSVSVNGQTINTQTPEVTKAFSVKRDNLTIRGHSFLHNTQRPKPTVIISHGVNSSSKEESNLYVKKIYQTGFNVFTFDFAGGGPKTISEGKTTDMTIDSEERDLNSVLNYVRSLPTTNRQNIDLAGCSQGGLVTSLLAVKKQRDINKLILYYPAFSLPDNARAGKFPQELSTLTFNPFRIPKVMEFMTGYYVSRNYMLSLQKISPWFQIKNFYKPVLITHGTADKTVPFNYSKKASYVFPLAKLVSIKDGTHGFPKQSMKDQAQQAVVKFLENK